MHHAFWTLSLFLLLLVAMEMECRARGRDNAWMKDDARARYTPRRDQRKRRSDRPNIIMVITDDQDVALGSMDFMPKTRRIIEHGGAKFENAFVSTPMCCPSRSSMLTGMYVHNHNVYTNNENCSSVEWQQKYEVNNFGTYLSNAGYRTGYFGKYLNEYMGTHIPPGWSEWVGLIRNTRFYNYSLNFNGERIRHGDNYHKDYLTDLIANDSVTFLKQSKQYFPNRPVAMVLSMPAPHGPEDAAPQYQNLFFNVTTHRVGAWNYAPNPDKQWILQHTGKMEPIHIAFTDLLQTKRLQTLQSVDDAVEKVYHELKRLGELDNTYFLYTSDHGYHLGQYGLVKGKAMPYDFDIRVPFLLRGPGIPRHIRVPNLVANIDIAPTFLDIAGVEIPDHMDGRSILRLFEGAYEKGNIVNGELKRKKAWRDTVLIERGKISHKKLIQRDRMEAQKNHFVTTKDQRLQEECQKLEYAPPCGPNQQWVCLDNGAGRLRMYKCRKTAVNKQNDATFSEDDTCLCHVVAKPEKRRQRQFLKGVVNQPDLLKPKFMKDRRQVNSTSSKPAYSSVMIGQPMGSEGEGMQENAGYLGNDTQSFDFDAMINDQPYPNDWQRASFGRKRKNRNRHQRHKRSFDELQGQGPTRACRVLPNNTVVCEEHVYSEFDSWKQEKNNLDNMIQQYRQRLDKLKDLRKHLKEVRPSASLTPLYQDIDGQSSIEEIIDTSYEDVDPLDPDDPFADPDSYEEYDDLDADLGDDLELDPEEEAYNLDLAEDLPAEFEGDPSIVGGEVDYSECDCQATDPGVAVNDRKRRIRKKRIERQQLRQERRDKRQEIREQRRTNKKRKLDPPEYEATKDCNSPSMKCFTHTDDHWKTPPYWNLGPFCFCPNSSNNTYWCLRTINDTHNMLYCEFITGFVSYYDMNEDPHQLRNAVFDLSYGMLHQLHTKLEKLKVCKGQRECTSRQRPKIVTETGSIDGELGEEGSGEIHSGESGDGELVTLSGGHHGHYMEISSVPYEENQVESSGDADELLKEDFLRLTKEFVLINP